MICVQGGDRVSLPDRFDALMDLLKGMPESPPSASERALLFVYEPELEADFRRGVENLRRSLELQGVPHEVLDLTTLPYEVLGSLLDKSFEFDAVRPKVFRSDLARRLEPRLVDLIVERSRALGRGLLILQHTAALFPWVSYAAVLKALPTGLPSYILIPFPGTDTGASLHFMGKRNGFDYLARRV